MTSSRHLNEHLASAGVEYEVIPHPRAESSSRVAQVAHIAGERVAKTVLLHADHGYLLAVVPSTHRVELDTLERLLDRRLSLATEPEIKELFDDCELGAVPPIGGAYGLDVVLDEGLMAERDIYFEAGDHRSLIHVSGGVFAALMADAKRARFSHHV